MKERDDEEVLRHIQPLAPIAASNSFRERVMKAIAEERARENSRTARGWKSWPRWVTIGCAAGLILLLLPMLRVGGGPEKSSGAALLAQSVQAMSKAQTVHILGHIRTLAGDNFELIGAEYDFVPIEIWREYSNPPRWRVEKPGRVVVMNGQTSTMYMERSNSAVNGTPNAGFIEWLRPMLDPQSILESELMAARKGAAQVSLSESNGVIVAAVSRQAQGNFANDWARNKSIAQSDHRCVYRFDSASKRLEGLQVAIAVAGKETVVAEFTDFRYNETLAESLYVLQLPADVVWITDTPSKSAPANLNGPRDAAVFFFNACASEDWDAVLQVRSETSVPMGIKQTYGGLQVIAIGEAFQSGLYPGYFVPYQVRLKDGYVKSYKIAIRNDNPEQRWVVDGGI